MRLSETLAMLNHARDGGLASGATDRLSDLAEFGDNPGNLRARFYVPEKVVKAAPLVVVLHGCTQSAASYDDGAGWSRLADKHGFILLFPEQKRANNPNLCFNWFDPGDIRRDEGEVASIRAMIAKMSKLHRIDAKRVYVTGLSAGGAMTSAMLATYPELFAGGAIIAGIAYGCAGSVGQAFECMGGRALGKAKALGDAVRAASLHTGPWPRVSVWHGTGDLTVTASNGDQIVRQWTDLHGLPAKPSKVEAVEGYPRRVWNGADGKPVIEQYVITGMGHGTPLAPGDEAGQSGRAGPHMLDAAISSTDRIAAFWGLCDTPRASSRPRTPRATVKPVEAKRSAPAKPRARVRAGPKSDPTGVHKIIEDALRAAGLMR